MSRSSDLVERAARLAQDSERAYKAGIRSIVDESGPVARRIVDAARGLSDSDSIVVAALTETSEYLAAAFAELPAEERTSITSAADAGDMAPLEEFSARAYEAASPDAREQIWTDVHDGSPPDEGPAPEPGVAETAARGFRFGSRLMSAIAWVRFAGSLADPSRTLTSKALRVGAVAAQMGWSHKTAKGGSESVAADAFLFADAVLGPYARKHGPAQTFRGYWRLNAWRVLHTEMPATPLRDFLLAVVEAVRLEVQPSMIAAAKAVNQSIRYKRVLNEAFVAQVLRSAFKELSFGPLVVTGDGQVGIGHAVFVGLQKGVLESSDDGTSLWVRGSGLRRTIAVPAGLVRSGLSGTVSLQSLFAAAAASKAFQGGDFVRVPVLLSTTPLAMLPVEPAL